MWLLTDDTVYIYELDRLEYSLRHLLTVVGNLQQLGVGLASLIDAINTTSAQDRPMFNLFASLAKFERELIREYVLMLVGLGPRSGSGGRPLAGPIGGDRTHGFHRQDDLPRAATRRQRDCPAPTYL